MAALEENGEGKEGERGWLAGSVTNMIPRASSRAPQNDVFCLSASMSCKWPAMRGLCECSLLGKGQTTDCRNALELGTTCEELRTPASPGRDKELWVTQNGLTVGTSSVTFVFEVGSMGLWRKVKPCYVGIFQIHLLVRDSPLPNTLHPSPHAAFHESKSSGSPWDFQDDI